MVSGHASSHPRGFQFGIEPLSQLDVFPRRSASREDIKLRYRFKPHWNPLGCEEAWSDTIIFKHLNQNSKPYMYILLNTEIAQVSI